MRRVALETCCVRNPTSITFKESKSVNKSSTLCLPTFRKTSSIKSKTRLLTETGQHHCSDVHARRGDVHCLSDGEHEESDGGSDPGHELVHSHTEERAGTDSQDPD